MGRRPLCAVCVFLMVGIWLAGRLGIPFFDGNPLPEAVQNRIREHPEAVIRGEVQRCTDTEFSRSVYLKNVYLICDSEQSSEQIPIKNVKAYLDQGEELPPGTRLLASGILEPVGEARNPGGFDSRGYYACQNIYYFLKRGVEKERIPPGSSAAAIRASVRNALIRSLEACAGEDAPVFQAMVLGEKSNLEEEQKLRYQMAGISHILAISGLHISLLGAGLYQLLKRAGAGLWISGVLSLFVMIQYGLLTGAGVSTMRAVCMFVLSVAGEMLGRIYDGMTALALAAILLLVESPFYLYNSSFQLSFGAVLGIGVVSPALIREAGVSSVPARAFLTSLGVQLATLPVVLVSFGEVSLTGIFLNLLVLPTVGVVLGSGFAGGILGLVSEKAGWAAVLPGRLFLGLYEWLGEEAGRLPFCTWIPGAPKQWQWVGYYLFLAAALIFGNAVLKKDVRGKKLWARLSLLLILPGLLLLLQPPLRGLMITCLDVGQGDAVLVETPENRHMLIDGGSTSRSGVGVYQLLPCLKNRGISRLDAVFISHTDEDHISGIRELLELIRDGLTSIRVKRLILPRWQEKNGAYEELVHLGRSAGAEILTGKAGDAFRAGSAEITLLSPPADSPGRNVNEEGMVLELRYGTFTGLFTGDIGQETEKRLMESFSDIDFLKVAHHGSAHSTSPEFLEKVKPEAGIISCSASNTYGHPSPETIARLEDAGCHLEYTMKNGAISLLCTEKGEMRIRRFIPHPS